MLAPQPFFEPRGTPFSVLGRIKALTYLGHSVDLLTYHVGEDVDVPGVTIIRTPKIPFIKRVIIGPSAVKVLLDFLLFLKAIQLLVTRRRYDLVHSHEEASFFGILLARLFRKPHLYDMHSSPTEQIDNFGSKKLRVLAGLFDKIERKVVTSSNAVITICPALEDHVNQIGGRNSQVMIENVVSEIDPLKIPDSDVLAFKANHPRLNGKKVILYAGTFEVYQGIDLLIKSAAEVVQQYEDVMFVMVGGKADQVKQYEDMAVELGIQEQFYFVGTRPPNEIPLFIRLSDILVSPRIDGTNTPLKIYSYLQSGVPIVATDLYTHTQVLNSKISMLTNPDSQSFADGILKILNDPELAASLNRNARQLFENEFSFQTYVQKTEKVLQMALA